MKITMTKVWAKPEGVATIGTILELPNKEAEYLIEQQFARPFDPKRDAKSKKEGFVTPEK